MPSDQPNKASCPIFEKMASSTLKVPCYVEHPAFPNKTLVLVAETKSHVPVSCNACSSPISGYHYSCGSSNLHIYCAGISPHLYIHHHHHPYPDHPISLRFFPPYQNGQFTCNLCRGWGGSHWLYSCTVCNGFDAHLGCAVKAAQIQPQFYESTTKAYPPSYGSTPHSSNPSSKHYSGNQPYYGAAPHPSWPSASSSHLDRQPNYSTAPHASRSSAYLSHLDTIGSCIPIATQLANLALGGSPFLDIGSDLLDCLQLLMQFFFS